MTKNRFLSLLAIGVILLGQCVHAGEKVKIGFLVKQPEEPWFQLEWKFADQAAKQYGFELIKIGVPDGEKVLGAIDNIAANGAQGFVICTPDVKLGPAIVARAKANNLKVLAVDDRFVGGDGKFMENVPYLGISARKIGNLVGETLIEQMKKRNWDIKDVGLCLLTFDEIDSVHERTEGTREAVIAAGFPESQIYSTPILQRVEIPTSLDAANALLTKRSDVKHWLIASGNDNGVLGAVRAMEGKNIKAEDAIGVGINGTDCIPELEKATPTSFYGSVLLSAREHGFMTAEMMYKWITEDKMPPLDTRTVGKLINRENFVQVLKDEGITD